METQWLNRRELGELDAPAKGGRPRRAAAWRLRPLCTPPQAWSSSATPEARQGCPAPQRLCSTPPSALFRRAHGPERGAGHKGCGHSPPRVLTSARASVRPSWGCCWDCGAGEAPTDSNCASPSPQALRWPRAGRRGRGPGAAGQAPRGREEAAPVGRGSLQGPARRGIGSNYLEEQRRPGKAPWPPVPGHGPELELVLDTLSRRWRGNPSELGRGSAVHRQLQGGGPPALLCAGWEPGIPWGPWGAPNCLRLEGSWVPASLIESGCGQGRWDSGPEE